MFAFPSPPVDSDLIPGMERKISAVALGAACSICAPEIELTETRKQQQISMFYCFFNGSIEK